MSRTVKPQEAGRVTPEELLAIWKEWKQTGDGRVRDRLVLTLAPMVKYIVYRKMKEIPRRCDVDDFISCGMEALIKSIERYEPAKGATLEQFAWTRIHGAVLDELRRSDWAPRSLRRFDRTLNKSREEFIAVHGRAPSAEESAVQLGMGVDELVARQDEVSRAQLTSLNAVVSGEEETTIERIDTLASGDRDTDPELYAMREHAKERLRAAFAELPERDQKVAVMLYGQNLTLKTIGDVLGVSESRICQIHAQLLQKLRAQLGDEEELFLAIG